MKPAVAIVIPVYNKCGTVARAIKSAQSQTVENIEIVIIDDGSIDCSKRAVLEAIKGDDRCKYVYQENAGVAIARTNGVLNHTTAPYVMCLDSDDAIEPRYLEHLVPHLRMDGSLGIVYTGLRYVLPDGKTGTSPWPTEFSAEHHFRGHNQVPTAAVTKRTVWERLGGQRQRYAPYGAGAEDGDFWLRAVSYGFNAKYIPPKRDTFFIYSWQSGIVSGDKNYVEVDYRQWSPWAANYNLMPTPSHAKPRLFSHPARQYDEPTVSVVIPVGPGHAKYLVDALDSLDAQVFKKWEAVVVFDVPKKEWLELKESGQLDYIARTWPFCRFTSVAAGGVLASELVDSLDVWEGKLGLLDNLPAADKSSGAGAARNAGVRLARAPLVLFLDADDWLVPTAIEKMVAVYKNTGDIIYTDHLALATIKEEDLKNVVGEVLDYNTKKGQALISQGVSDYRCQRAMEQPYMDGRAPYVICNVSALLPRKLALRGFDESMDSWEDVLFFWELAWSGECFTRIPEPLLVYRYSTGLRRDYGFANRQKLLEYLAQKSRATKKMGCGCKNKPEAVVIHASQASTGDEEMINLPLSRGGTLRVYDSDIVLIEFNPPDRGSKMRYGVHDFGYGSIKYGYYGGGETFYVHKQDIEADKQIARAQGREPMFIPLQVPEDVVVEEPGDVQELDAPVPVEELLAESEESVEEFTASFGSVPGAVQDASEAMAEFAATASEPAETVGWLADELDAADEIEFPEPVGNDRLTQLEDLDYGDGLKNPDRFIERLHGAGIYNALDIINFERDHKDGIAEIKGIGPTARKVFVEAAKNAVGI